MDFIKQHPMFCILSNHVYPPAVCMCLHVCVLLCVCEFFLGWHPGPSCRSTENLRQAGYPQGTLEPEAASWPNSLSTHSSTTHTHTLRDTPIQSPLYFTPKKSSIDLSNVPPPPQYTHLNTFRVGTCPSLGMPEL